MQNDYTILSGQIASLSLIHKFKNTPKSHFIAYTMIIFTLCTGNDSLNFYVSSV